MHTIRKKKLGQSSVSVVLGLHWNLDLYRRVGCLLTAGGMGCVEDESDLCVHVDRVLLLAAELMPFVHSLFNPLLEALADYRVD